MRMLKSKFGIVSLSLVAAAGLILAFGSAAMGDPDSGSIKKIAEMIKKGDTAGAKKAAAAYAAKTSDVEDLMTAFKSAKKKGLGVTGTDNGIEQLLVKIGRDAPTAATVEKLAKAYEEMGYDIAAVGMITEALEPTKDNGKKTKKAWVEASAGMIEAGIKIAEAGKAKSAADIKTQASKINNNCGACHNIFRN